MSNKYKTAMDKITLSDEMKKKIMAAAAEKPDNENQKKIKRFPFGHAMSLAACIVLVLIAAFAGGELYDTGLTPGNDITVPVPSETEHPFTDDNKDKSIDDSNNNINDSSIQPDIDSKKEDSMAAGRASVSKSNPEASAKAPVPPAATNEPTQNDDTSLMPNDGNIPEDNPDDMLQSRPPAAENNDPSYDELEQAPPDGGGSMGGNPFEELSIADIEKKLGYKIKTPSYMPDGYTVDETALMFDTMVQITYTSKEDTIYYRTEKCSEDISGDYNVYQDVKTEDIGGREVTVKGDGTSANTAVWQDEEEAYSVYSQNGIAKEEIKKIVEGVK